MITPRRLPHDEAWAIATRWLKELRGLVTLVLAEDVAAVVETYEWISIKLTSPRVALAARATSIAWWSLARCRGYALYENPVFWRLVLDAMRAPSTTVTDSPLILDTRRLFDRHAWQFPRCSLCADKGEDVKALSNLFLGHTSSEMWNEIHDQLSQDVTSMDNCIAHTSTGAIQVQICGAKFDELRELLLENGERIDTEPSLSPLHVITATDQILLSDSEPTVIDALTELLQTMPIEIPRISFAVEDSAQEPTWNVLAFVDVALQLSKRYPGRVKELVISGDCHIALIAAVFSGLPFTKSLVSVTVDSDKNDATSPEMMLWLSYALCHPDTPTSTWKSLRLKDLYISNELSLRMGVMSRENHLEDMLAKCNRRMSFDNPMELISMVMTTHVSDYKSARVESKATIYTAASRSSTALVTLADATDVDVCVSQSSYDMKPVIVPGYGQGWARREDLKDTRSR